VPTCQPRSATSCRRSTILSRIVFILASTISVACGSTPAGGNTGTIALSIAPATATLQAGGSVDLSVTLARGGGFSGSVTYAVEGTPGGITGSVAAVDATTATVRFAASASAVPGTYQISVRAKATGVSDATATLSLIVAATTAGSFTIILPSSPTSVTPGSSASVSIGIVRYQGFAGDVTLSATGLPVGVTSQFSPAVVGGLGTIMALDVGANVPPATYHLTVRGTAANQTDVTQTFTLVVAPPPTFSITAGVAAVNVVQGSSNQTYLKVIRGAGLVGSVSYTVTGVPTGLAVAAVTTSVADSVALTVSATSGLAGGSYPVVIHASVSGAAEQTASITVLVATTAGVDVHLDYSACPQSSVVRPAVWVAYQDGTGPWTRVAGAGGIYNFHINSSGGGIAVVRQLVQFYTTSVTYLTQAELQATLASCGEDASDVVNPYPAGSKTIHGTIARLNAGTSAQILLGSANAGQFGVSGPATAFQLSGVLDGPQDLVALRYAATPDRMVIRRDLNLPDGGSVAPIDFDGAEGFAPLVVPLQLAGFTPGVRGVVAVLDYLSGAGCTVNRYNLGTPNPDGSMQVFGVPAAQQRSGDFHSLVVFDYGDYTGALRYARNTAHLLTAQAVAFGATMPTSATITPLAGGYPRLQAAFVPPADYTSAGLYFHDGLGHVFTVTASTGYRGQQVVQISAPDLSGVAGYDKATWAPAAAAAQVKILGKASTQRLACSEGVTRYAEQVVTTGP
jgi:hypothetical protein